MHQRQFLWAITGACSFILPRGLADTGGAAEVPQASAKPAVDGSLPNIVLVFVGQSTVTKQGKPRGT